ncbi:MAG: L,D-transpeptidase family protein [Hyphomicrobiales bacterium]|nr:L,D-transpeptidase family protein [Hyphomicrobiales bacterium]
MSGVRLDRFVTSTAVALLLSGVSIGAYAEPIAGSTAATAMATPTVAAPSGPASEAQPAATAPAPATESTPSAAPTKPEAAADQPASAPSTPQVDSAQPPAATPATAEAPAAAPQPAPAAATETAPPLPTAATGGDEVPAAASAVAATPAAAAAPTATPAPSAVADANAAVTEQLRDLANGKFDRIVGGKKERAAIEAFYSARDYAPLWITDGKPNARATAAIGYLGQVDADGLDPADYPVPNVASLEDPAALAEAEIRLTTSVVAYVHHAQVGRVHWSRVSGDIFYDRKPSAPAEVLAALAESKNVGETLDSYEPHDPAYVALKAKLAELRAGKQEPPKAQIPNGPAPRLGARDDRVPLLRQRLGLPAGDGTTFDKALSAAVKKFQQERALKVTGTLSTQTIEALNGHQPDRPIDTIIANLERWRWMPHDLGPTYVIVNLPDFTLRVMHEGKEMWKTKIVDGKPNMPTPIMSAEMKYITVNPTWNVPPSIVAREYMPVLQQDPSVLQRMGLSVTTNPDGTVHISQPPGDRNALGRLRFNFPNKFLVYQHDTPEKHLFAFDRRAFSHGCMRVQDPVKYAEVLLSLVRPRDDYTEEKIRRMFGNSEVDIQFPQFIPVHLTYQTAFVDEAGKLEFRDDVYGRDKALLAILKGDERKVADIPIARPENTIRREALAMPDSGFGGFGSGGFFSRLFGGGSNPPPPAPTPQRKRSAQRTEIR